MRDLPEVDGVGTEEGLDLLGEVLHLERLAHLGRHQHPDAGGPGHLDGAVGALVVGHPAEEHHVRALLVAGAVAHRELGRLDPVVDDPGDGDLRGVASLGVGDGDDRDPLGHGAVEVRELLVEGSVDGGGDREVGVVLGVERSDHRVVVHHVALADRLVGVDDVADLRHRHPDPLALGVGEHPLAGHRTGGVAGGVEEDIVAGVLEAAGQLVDDQLDPPVEGRRNGCPGRGDQSDAHGEIQASCRAG